MLFTTLTIVAASWQGDTTEVYKHSFTPARNVSECQITRIVDGDTIHCDGIGSVRLIGVDTPDGNQPPYGPPGSSITNARIISIFGSRSLLEQHNL